MNTPTIAQLIEAANTPEVARLCIYGTSNWAAAMQRALLAQAAQPAQSKQVPEGYALVPIVPTREMLNAMVDVDSFKLGDISPLGFRISPQQLFERCYKAMLAAAPQAAQPQASEPQYPAEWAKLLHYPDCWDTAAYPTLQSAIHEALAWSGCSVCKPPEIDCRQCENRTYDGECRFEYTGNFCTNGDKFVKLPSVRLWREG